MVLALVAAGEYYRQVGRLLNISKNTALDIVKRAFSQTA
jgi:putative DNA-invertase from lambdoid prophage Rac